MFEVTVHHVITHDSHGDHDHHGGHHQLRRIEQKLDDLLQLVAALVDEGSDREAAKALAVQVAAQRKALQDAIPK